MTSPETEGARRQELRRFGLGLAGGSAVALLALPIFRGGSPHRLSIAIVAILVAIALAAPSFLRRPHGWITGAIQHLVTIFSVSVLAVVYYTCITATASLLRLIGKDPLDRVIDRRRPTYRVPAAGPLMDMEKPY